jgi:hypothetical protein
MSVHNATLQPEQESKSRNRFLIWFFAAGTLVPGILIIVGKAVGPTRDWSVEGQLGTVFMVLTWVIWPTWLFMIDAEHAPQIVFILLLAAPINGLWYGAVGLVLWYLRRSWKRSDSGLPSCSDQ